MKISIVKEKEIVIELREINDSNHNDCIGLQEHLSNPNMLFLMNTPLKKQMRMRFMIDASLQGKGYGKAALKEIIHRVIHNTKAENRNAVIFSASVYLLFLWFALNFNQSRI